MNREEFKKILVERVIRELEASGIGTRLYFAGNITRHPAYSDVSFRVSGPLDNSDTILRDVFWIGVHPGLDRPRLDYMLERLRAIISAC